MIAENFLIYRAFRRTPDDKYPWSPKKLFDDSFDGYETNGPQWYKVAINVDDSLHMGK